MGILDIFGKKDATKEVANGPPYSVSTELVPYRLYAKKSSSATLRIRVKNLTKDVLLTSLVAQVPNQLGFDDMIMSKQKEIKIGDMQPQEEKELKFSIYTSLGSDAGEYTMTLTTISHYRDYGHVLNEVTKRVSVSLV